MTATRGWVTDSGCTLAAHSIVRRADGQLFDVTPFHEESMPRQFVEHHGDDTTFHAMRKSIEQIHHNAINQNALALELEALGVVIEEDDEDEPE